MSNSSVSISAGPGFIGTLTIVFIVLKLVGTISWSWWWVLSPLWLSLVLAAVVVLIGIAIWGIFT